MTADRSTSASPAEDTTDEQSNQRRPQSFAEMFNHLLQGQFGDYVMGERRFDDIITRLMEEAMAQGAAGRSGPPPMTDQEIATQERITYEATNDEQCTICRDSFQDGATLISLICKHRFHEECIIPWLKTTATCPVCRRELKERDDEKM